MSKKVIIGIIVAVIAIAGGVIAYFAFNKKETPNTLELSYNSNGGVPYKWEYTIDDPSIVEFVESHVVDDQNKDGRVGAPITTNYVFKGLKEGSTKITFKYVNITDKSVDKEEVNVVKVDKNKNISLVADSK